MRLIPPPMTEAEILFFLARSTEKLVGELEARVRRPVGAAYPARWKERDVERLARCREVVENADRRLRVMAMGRASKARKAA